MPWLVWLNELNASLQTKGSSVRFPVRAHAWVEGQVPSWGFVRGNHPLMFLSLSFLLPSPLSKHQFLKVCYRSNTWSKNRAMNIDSSILVLTLSPIMCVSPWSPPFKSNTTVYFLHTWKYHIKLYLKLFVQVSDYLLTLK